jgi:hypothetical protein
MKILCIVLSCLISQSFAQDRGGLNKLVDKSENTGINAELKKKLAFNWVADKQQKTDDCTCYIAKANSFYINLSEDGSFTSQSWAAVRKTDAFGEYQSGASAVLPNEGSKGTWSVSDFMLVLRYEDGEPVRLKVSFDAADKMKLQAKYHTDDTNAEIGFSLLFVRQ